MPELMQPPEEEALYRLLAALGVVAGTAAAEGGGASGAETARDLELPATLSALALPPAASARITAVRDNCLKLLAK